MYIFISLCLSIYIHLYIYKYMYIYVDPGRCKTSSVCQSAGLLIPRSSVRFRQKLKKSRTQSYMDLSYIDPQARVLGYCYK